MYHVIINGNYCNEKAEKLLQTVCSVFEKAGKKYAVYKTEHTGHATQLARQITAQGGEETLIAVGGDGTLHEVLNGIRNVENCELALIPFGSGNDFAEALNLPFDPKIAAENIAFLAPKEIDFIQLSNGLRSINAVGMGIDVDVLKRAYGGKKTGKGKYFSAFIKSLIHYKSGKYRVTYDGIKEEHEGMIVCLGNGKQIGGGIKVFPEAKADDGYIDLIMVDCLTRWRTLLAFIKLMTGKVNKVREVTHVRCKQVKVEPLNGTPSTIQAEGEIYEGIELDAKIIEGKLKFYLPNND